jgi:hypothetical protein
MAEKLKRIPFDEFARDLAHFFKRVTHEHETVIVETATGEGVVIRPLDTTATTHSLTDEDYAAFRSAFGGWADVDTDSLKEAIYESRKSSRPPAKL